jgi:hypothetical protein
MSFYKDAQHHVANLDPEKKNVPRKSTAAADLEAAFATGVSVARRPNRIKLGPEPYIPTATVATGRKRPR